MVPNDSQTTRKSGGSKGRNEPIVPKGTKKISIRPEWLEHAQILGLPLEEAIDQGLQRLAQIQSTSTKVEAYRDPAFNKLVFARMPIESRNLLERRAAHEGLSVSYFATTLVEEFLLASKHERPDVPIFDAPRRGRATAEERTRMNKLRAGLATVGLKLTDAEAKQIAEVAAEMSRQKQDALGGIIMAALEK